MYSNNNRVSFRSYNNSGGGGGGGGGGGRMWGMSNSLPSGMSNYANYSPLPSPNIPPFNPHHMPPYMNNHQDSDFPSMYMRRGGSMMGYSGNNGYSSAAHSPIPPVGSYHQDPEFAGLSMFGRRGGGGGGGMMGPMGSSSSTSSLTGNTAGTNLIVNYLPQDMSERELYSLFSTMGPIESYRIMRDMKTGYSYGFGFVNFATDEAASRAIKCLNGLTVRNKRLKVSFARPSGDDIKETNLYVTNLPKTITEEMLDVIFGKYGTIVQKNILRDKITGQPRGVAFVRFNKRDEAQEAISALNNVIPQGSNQPLTVRVAEEHGRQKGNVYMPTYNSALHRGGRPRMRPHNNSRPY